MKLDEILVLLFVATVGFFLWKKPPAFTQNVINTSSDTAPWYLTFNAPPASTTGNIISPYPQSYSGPTDYNNPSASAAQFGAGYSFQF